ncbi:MAG TPA: hypothetical protein VEN47_02480, partial [Myxococcota bacterium]|nr:hypothetical protein [Myxococcota bacterium]
MRVSTARRLPAFALAAALVVAAPAARARGSDPLPGLDGAQQSATPQQDQPTRSWNQLGPDDETPQSRSPRGEWWRARQKLRQRWAREAAQKRKAAAQAQADAAGEAAKPAEPAPAEPAAGAPTSPLPVEHLTATPASESADPDEPPSFGDALDRWIPPEARSELAASWARWAPRIEATLHQTYTALPPAWQARVDFVGEWASRPASQNWLLGGLCALVVALVVARAARGAGDLIVCIAYPDDLRGSFTVSVTRRKPNRKRQTAAEREAAKTRVSSRTVHHLVSRETQFRGLAPGKYWVTVDGELCGGAAGDGVLEEPFETMHAQVGSRDARRIEFDLKPRHCPVEIRVSWDGQPVRECAVSVGGRPDTFRHLRGQSARIGLPLGRHLVALGSGDRVAEREVVVESYATLAIEVDLGKNDGVLFKGCPPAVTPYLQGDVAAAAR